MFMSGVNAQWNMALNIGGKDFIANPTSVKECFWFETIHQQLPSLSLTLMDKTGEFSNIVAAGDGVPIEITLGDGGFSGETSATFNILGAPQIQHGAGYNQIKLNAVLNSLPYLRRVATGLFEGTSSSVLGQIAGQAGLAFEGDQTADQQVWLSNVNTLAGFSRAIANHGWVGQGSLMMLAVTSLNKLVYRNVMAAIPGGETFGYERGDVTIIDWDATTNAMVTANNRGFGSTSIGFTEEGVVKELNKITFGLFSSVLAFSQKNISAIGDIGGRIDQVIRSAGNTHDFYDEAKHQNTRLRASFSNDLNILTAEVTQTELLKKAMCIPLDYSTSKPNAALTGPYVLTARTRTLTRSKYQERLTMTSSGES